VRLPRHELEAYTSQCEHLAPGCTSRFNHVGCASTSSSRSLAVTRTDTGGYLLHCHKCGGSGSSGGIYRQGLDATPVTSKRLPAAWEYRIGEFPVPVKIWLNKSRVPWDKLSEEGVRYDTANEVLQFSIWGGTGETRTPTGRINRRFSEAEGPKYISTGVRWRLFRTNSTTVVVVEDYLSALQVVRAGFNALFLGGTRCSSDCLQALLEGNAQGEPFKEAVIYLDNDNPAVRQSQRDIARTLGMYLKTRVIRETRDPKGLTIDELRRVLCQQ